MSASSWKAGRLEGWKEGTRAAAALEKAEAASGLGPSGSRRTPAGATRAVAATARRPARGGTGGGEAQDTWQAASTLRKDIKNKKIKTQIDLPSAADLFHMLRVAI